VGAGKRKRLEATVAAIQGRWGRKALQRGPRPEAISALSTGFPALDGILAGSGGLPRGRITELLGEPTSGMATLALKVAAGLTAPARSAYVDLAGTFDPDYAARCGVNLERLLLVRPHRGLEGLDIVLSLLSRAQLSLIIFDSVTALRAEADQAAALSARLAQLPALLSRTPCALLFLTPLRFGPARPTANYPSYFALPHLATLRLELRKEQWLYRDGEMKGYQARVRVLSNKLGRAGQQATLAITFNGVVQGDGL